MYQISSKTGVRHVVESEQPSGEAVLKMWHGRDLPTARCGRELEPVNFYEADEKPNPRYTCSRCFAGVPVGASPHSSRSSARRGVSAPLRAVSHRQAREPVMTITTVTAPIALARRARHRKPSQRRNILKGVFGGLASVAAIGGTMAFASAQPGAQPFYGLTATQAATVSHIHACPAGDSRDCYMPRMPWHTVVHACHVRRDCAPVGTEIARELGIVGRSAVLVMPARADGYVLAQDGTGTDVYGS